MTYFKPNQGPIAQPTPEQNWRTDEAREIWLSMPRTIRGVVQAIMTLPEPQQEPYYQKWIPWCKETPKHWWPLHVKDYQQVRKKI